MAANELCLRTKRLRLVAGTLAHIDAELHSPESLGALLGVSIPPNWPPGEYDRKALEFFRFRLRASGPAHGGWCNWYVLARDAQSERESLVAGAGFFGPPSGDAVEVGFSVIPEARGRGYATEIVEALVGHAFGQTEVQVVVAHVSEANAASTHVLLRCGFRRAGPGEAPGAVKYLRARTTAAQHLLE